MKPVILRRVYGTAPRDRGRPGSSRLFRRFVNFCPVGRPRTVGVYFWGVVADRHGRRPVVFISLLSTAAFATAFGLSTTFFSAFLFRFFLGMFNGLTALWSTLVAEICGKEHDIVGTGVLTTAWSIGVFGGSGLGGMLAEPAIHFPSVFSASGVFGRFPYLLPNLMGAGLTMAALPLVFFFLPETLPKGNTDETELGWWVMPTPSPRWSSSARGGNRQLEYFSSPTRRRRSTSGSGGSTSRCGSRSESNAGADVLGNGCGTSRGGSRSGSSASIGAFSGGGSGSATPKPTLDPIHFSFDGSSRGTLAGSSVSTAEIDDAGERLLEQQTSLLAEPRVRFLLFPYGIYMFISHLEQVFSLWALSTVAKGGLDWSTKQIGQVFLACGGLVLVFELLLLRVLLGRFGIKGPVRAATIVLVPVTALLPSISSLQGQGDLPVWATVAFLFIIFSSLDLCITGIFLAINNTTGPERRGELNGLASTVASAAAMVGPAVWAALFASSIEGSRPFPIDFHLTFYCKAALKLVVALLAWNMSADDVEDHDHPACEDGKKRCTDDDRGLELRE